MKSNTLEPRSSRLAVVRYLPVLLASTAVSHAQEVVRHEVRIEAQSVGAALKALAAQTGLQVLVFSQDAANKLSPGIKGNLTNDEALAAILDDSGLTYKKIDDNTVAVGRKGAISASQKTLHSTRYAPSQDNFEAARSDSQAPATRGSAQQTIPEGRADNAEKGIELPQIQEVLVTARKITERIQDVPASIIALGADQLAASGAVMLEDIGREVPGLNVVAAGPGKNQLIIRGLSSSGGGSMVGYYIDDTPIASSTDINETSAVDPVLFDLARVEVLRGPQGTLYGASSMGGTVKYVTQQPDLTQTSGLSKVTLSDTQGGGFNREVDTVGNVPLVENVAAVRLAAFYRYNDGYIDRYDTNPADYLAILPGVAARNVNSESTYGGRIALKVQPIDSLTITPSAFVQHMGLGGQSSFDVPAGSFANPIQNRLLPEPTVDQIELYSLNVHGDLNPISITSSTSYFIHQNRSIEDESKVTYFFYSPTGYFPAGQTAVYPTPFYLNYPNHNFTEELRLGLETTRVHGILGVFYQRVAGFSLVNWVLPGGYNTAFGDPFPGQTSVFYSTQNLTDIQKALFGEFNIDVTSKLKATVGGRAFKQGAQFDIFEAGTLIGGVPTQALVGSHASGFTPKYGLSYNVTADLMAYATASKGFREGGSFVPVPTSPCLPDLTQLGLSAAPTQYKPDTLWNYELGAKTQWLDRRLTLNGDIYDIQWKNTQQTVSLPVCGFSFIGNFGSASSKGAELEIEYDPVKSMRFSLASAFNEAKLTSTVPGTSGVSGQPLLNAPKWTGSASTEYRRDMATGTTLVARVDFNTSSRAYNTFDTTALNYVQPGYSLMNARLSALFGACDVSLFATNLLNKHAETALPNSYGSFLPTQAQVALNRPRTVGLDVKVSY